MQRIHTWFWLIALLSLFGYFALYYKVLPLRSKFVLGAGILIAAMLYSYRSALAKRQKREKEEDE